MWKKENNKIKSTEDTIEPKKISATKRKKNHHNDIMCLYNFSRTIKISAFMSHSTCVGFYRLGIDIVYVHLQYVYVWLRYFIGCRQNGK